MRFNDGVESDRLKKFDGWKLIDVSEYTTSGKYHSEVVMCFEQPTAVPTTDAAQPVPDAHCAAGFHWVEGSGCE